MDQIGDDEPYDPWQSDEFPKWFKEHVSKSLLGYIIVREFNKLYLHKFKTVLIFLWDKSSLSVCSFINMTKFDDC